ncbi:SusC/RagA family TonB-linked outer membrane protein [Pedobacter africanus]|uniref:Uncharacterized protein n=1 Tax=Pedobacter africanus TaxID=151894 RepID=A0ACC6L1D6_9SPHI|nr:carboxypeptidase-like regulatory domain-containing protein [Pedobacter africanus]MDR6785235.1 hypothetical protein [Pedobacter africanus]
MYKKYVDKAGVLQIHLGKLWKIMRLITIIMTLTIIQVSAAGYAQRLSISRSNASLKTVMKEIKSKVDFDFICTDNLFRKSKLVNINVKDMELEQLLKQIFEEQPLTYVIDSKTIVIKDKPKITEEPSFMEKIIAQLQVIELSGRVVDEKGLPLPGAIVKLKKEKKSYPANRNGEFIIRCPDEHAIICISYVGYITRELPAKAIQANPQVRLEVELNKLSEVGIQSKIIGTKIDLRNRSHQNLAQVLEGGVPGLTLKRNITTNSGDFMLYGNRVDMTLKENYEYFKKHPSEAGPSFFVDFPDFESYYRYVYNTLNIREAGSAIKIQGAVTDNGMVPELRGASTFSGGTSGMLVVIDGFVQDNFPSNYPMNNVASIEVIRDPVECIKWGPKAAGGVILITTNLPKSGELQIGYNSNFYFSPRQNISAAKLQLASSADLLDYYKEAYDKKIATYIPEDQNAVMPKGLSPAEMILFDLGRGKFTKEAFNHKWDSLSNISNRDQLLMLRQHTFNQNHSLSASGGTKIYGFSINGVYDIQRGATLGERNRRLGLTLKNDLSLVKNRLKIRWVADMNSNNSKLGTFDDGSKLDPYQLLVDETGKYVYNYTTITPDENNEMVRLGYYHGGVNVLEDARLNSVINRVFRINSNLNLDWKLTNNLQWSASIRYSKNREKREDLKDGNSSYAREQINKYGAPDYNDSDNRSKINFYVPPGGIFKATAVTRQEYNIRSGLVYDRVFNSNHAIKVAVDAGLSNFEDRNIPNMTVYGYNKTTGRGLPLLASANTSIVNFLGSYVNLGDLTVADLSTNSYTRNVSLNGDFSYSYKQRYSLNADYSAVLVPDFGGDPPYSTTSNRSISGIWQVNKEKFLSSKWLSNLALKISASEMQVAKLPLAQVSGSRIVQPSWNNSALNIDSYNKAEQSGQKNRDLGAKIDIGVSQERIRLEIGYNYNSIGKKGQWNARFVYDIGREPYFKVPVVSNLRLDIALQDINPYQGLNSMINAGSISGGGGFNMPPNSNLGLLPPAIRNKEARLMIGLVKDRFTLDARYYQKTTAGLSKGNLPTDPATGLSSQVNYSKIVNKGLEISLRAGLVQNNSFSWTATVNGAYNINAAIDVPPVNFSLTSSYMTASRDGYSTDNLWSFRWAGLDTLGNPQVYNKAMQKVAEPDSMSLVYSGRTRAPWSGALIQEWRYKGFFTTARLMFNLGHVMRRYMPVLSSSPDRNIQIKNRWRKAGDEAFTDVAGIAKDDFTRALIIQQSSNSIMPAAHIRLREIQFGYEVPPQVLRDKFIKSLTLSFQMENVALWTRNKMHIDPEVTSDNGSVRMPLPKNYILSINMSF